MKTESKNYLDLAAQAYRVLSTINTPALPNVFYEYVAELGQRVEKAWASDYERHLISADSRTIGPEKRALREHIRERYCRILVGIARGFSEQMPGITDLYRMPYQRWPEWRFLQHARSMLNFVRQDRYWQIFSSHGIDEAFLTEFADALLRFEELQGRRRRIEMDGPHYTRGVGFAEEHIPRLLGLIDALLYPHLIDHPDALEQWQRLCPPSRKFGGKKGRGQLALASQQDPKRLAGGANAVSEHVLAAIAGAQSGPQLSLPKPERRAGPVILGAEQPPNPA